MKKRNLKVMLLCFVLVGCFCFNAFAPKIYLGVRRFEQEETKWC